MSNIEEIKKVGVRVFRGNEWEIERDLVLKEEKMYVLKNEELRLEVIQLYYNILIARHEDRWKTIKLVMRNYWWSEVTKNIGKYVDGCDLCQRMKNKIEALVEKFDNK